MPVFRYKARNRSGSPVMGVLDAPDPAAVLKQLQELNYAVVTVKEVPSARAAVSRFLESRRRISQRDVTFITRQLAVTLKAGLPLLTALRVIGKQLKHQQLHQVLTQVADDVEGGTSLSEALRKHPRAFPGYYCSMVHVGEVGGTLSEVMERLATLGFQEVELREKIQSAMMYPVILVFFALGVLGMLVVVVLPSIVGVFEGAGAELPIMTRVMLQAALLLRNGWWVILIAMAIAGWRCRIAYRDERVRKELDRRILDLPVIGDLIRKRILAQFMRTLSSLTSTGVQLLEGLEVAQQTIGNRVIHDAVVHIRLGIRGGAMLSELLAVGGIFPPLIVQMVSVGEQTGQLDHMLEEVAAYYEIEVDYGIRRLTTLLEPVLLIVMGVLVAFIALSILMPMLDMVKLFRG